MAGYIIFIQDKTKDLPAAQVADAMAKYSAQTSLGPNDKLEILAAKTGKFQVLEGGPAEAVVIMRFPTADDAMAWYNSDAYQKSIAYRNAVREYRVIMIEGV